MPVAVVTDSTTRVHTGPGLLGIGGIAPGTLERRELKTASPDLRPGGTGR